MKKKAKEGAAVKSVSFQSTSRAQHEYQQAIQIMGRHPEKSLVKIVGNVVIVPVWFPFSSN
jgi:hypothetical protein